MIRLKSLVNQWYFIKTIPAKLFSRALEANIPSFQHCIILWEK